MNNLTNRGAFIVFEGCDRCGKSTQTALLADYLKSQGVAVKHMVSPDRQTPSGGLINLYLTNKQDMPDESIHLLFAMNRWEAHNNIKNLLLAGTTLLVDRYSYSGVAYSAAKGLSFEWCRAPERGLIRPDLVFYLNTDIDTLSRRGNFGEERYEKKEFQKNVLKIFDEICETEQSYWRKVNASQSIDSIHEYLSREALKIISEVGNKDLELLWKLEKS